MKPVSPVFTKIDRFSTDFSIHGHEWEELGRKTVRVRLNLISVRVGHGSRGTDEHALFWFKSACFAAKI
jgi:hypothetical protein